MKILVFVRPGAYQESVEKRGDNNFVVSVKEPPLKGLANLAVIRALAEYFKVPQARVTIVRGHTSRKKIIEITDQ